MAGLCNIELKQHEKEILKLLTDYIVFAGRYPVPKKEKEAHRFHNNFESQIKTEDIGGLKIKSIDKNKNTYLSQDNFEKLFKRFKR